jgi:ribosomal protein L34
MGMEEAVLAEGITQAADARKADFIRRETTGSGRTIMAIRVEKGAMITGTDMISRPDRRIVKYPWQSN